MVRFLILLAALVLQPAPLAAEWAEVYEKGVISEDTTWSGKVKIVGALMVQKGATLTILPGTKVVFAWSDEDGNGIGDGELKVEGRLVAAGTTGEMIVFTSGREEPAMKDWTYVMVELSRDSRLEHCIFEYAFTGLQLHFSTGVVRNNIFRLNLEALRFSTSDLLIEKNDIVENRYGIRYESRGSETTITRNNIVGNDYGFFPIIKSTSSVKVEENNIESGNYNVNIGQRQSADLDFRRNWWGTADREEIEERLFDGRRDSYLGRVLYEPFLQAPVPEAGRDKVRGREE